MLNNWKAKHLRKGFFVLLTETRKIIPTRRQLRTVAKPRSAPATGESAQELLERQKKIKLLKEQRGLQRPKPKRLIDLVK